MDGGGVGGDDDGRGRASDAGDVPSVFWLGVTELKRVDGQSSRGSVRMMRKKKRFFLLIKVTSNRYMAHTQHPSPN